MEISIDISIFVGPEEAFGNITGNIHLQSKPSSGDFISLFSLTSKQVSKVLLDHLSRIKVKSILFISNNTSPEVVLELDDIVVGTEEDAHEIVNYLVHEYGLYFDEY